MQNENNIYKVNAKKRALAVLGAFVLVALALGLAITNVKSRPKPEIKPPAPKQVNVVAQTIPLQNLKPELTSTGSVEAWQESQLSAQVVGRVVWLCDCLENGNQVEKGQELARLESADYQVALANSQQMVAQAEQNILQEVARADQARLDWTELNLGEPTDLALRKPQLAAAKAALASSKTQLAQAKRNLSRTSIRAPYSGIITSRRSNVGDFIGIGSSIGSVLNTQKALVKLSINANDVYKVNQDNSTITLSEAGAPYIWKAKLVRIGGTIDPKTRLLNVIAEVDEPYNTEKHPAVLRVGSFVNASFIGKTLDNVYELPNSALLSDNTLFVVDNKDKLKILTANIRHRSSQSVLVEISEAKGQDIQVVTEGQSALIPDTEVVVLPN